MDRTCTSRPGRSRPVAVTMALLLAATPLAAPLAAQLGERAGDPLGSRVERAVDMLRAHQDTSGVAGLSAAIAVDGRLVWAGGFGHASVQQAAEAGPEMVSRVGSISKPIAAVAAMALWDEGKLDLDAPITTYLPDYPAANGGITLRQLMSHTAGVRHYRDDEFLSNQRYDDVMSPLTVFWQDSLLFEPGTEYSYSTYGWTVVSAVTEAADGERTWVAILRDEVIGPLGLVHLQPEWQ
ncbi:MAG: serine hydrolase, partial [Gemmatimonadetes bacterium]|nr:serine hydrolase [Gemmatimonadota bacterium]